jgi:AcrR family transcriptional regulator
MSVAESRSRRGAETRAQLIDTAKRVFVERGYHATSLAHVTEAAGFTTGAIYAHFAGKDDLFLAVYEEFARERAAEVAEELAGVPGDFASQARAAADHWTARHAEHPEFTILTLEFAVHALRRPDLRAALAERHAIVRRASALALERHAAATETSLPISAGQIATALRELGVGLSLAQLIDPEAVPAGLYGDFVESYVRTLFPEETPDA